jgi:hypothetical protein
VPGGCTGLVRRVATLDLGGNPSTLEAQGVRLRSFLFDFIALALILVAPFVILLTFNDYSYATPEVLLILAVALCVAALLAVLLGFVGRIAWAVVIAALLALFIDVQLVLPRGLSWAVTLGFLAATAALAALLLLVREHATKILSVIFVTLIALTVLRDHADTHRIVREQGAAAAAGDSSQPLLIHLLLDEHIGIEGLPPEVPHARELRTDLIDFYTSRGFRLFGGAYSQYANTFNSIANLLNFAARDVDRADLTLDANDESWDLRRATYFQLLQQRGYRLHVYQSTYMDLCHAEGVQPHDCTTYPVASLGMLQGVKLPAAEKASAIANALVTQSSILHVLNKVYERGVRSVLLRASVHAPAWRWQPPSFGPLLAPEVFDRLRADVVAHPRGNAYFAHLVFPHYPYVFDRRCALRSRTAEWLTNRIASTDVLVYNTADSRAERYERYFEQIRCALTKLDELLDDLDNRGLLKDAIVIVNGDHGSRIPIHLPSGATLTSGVLTEQDYRDTFSTLYAIKAPGVVPGYVDDPLSVVELLDHHVAGEPLSESSSCRVFLLDEQGNGTLAAAQPKFCSR